MEVQCATGNVRPCEFNWYQLKLNCSVIQKNSNWSPVKSQLPPVEINWNLLYNQLVPVESHLVPVENAIQLVPVKTCPEIRENSNWSPVRSQLPPVEINWNLLQSTGSR